MSSAPASASAAWNTTCRTRTHRRPRPGSATARRRELMARCRGSTHGRRRPFRRSSAYVAASQRALDGQPADTPLFADGRPSPGRARRDRRPVTRRSDPTRSRPGFEAQRLSARRIFPFAVTDEDAAEEAGLSDAALANSTFEHRSCLPDARRRRCGPCSCRTSGRPAARLTVSGGVRFDASRLLLSRRQQLSPRLGVAYRARSTRCCAARSAGFSSRRSRKTSCCRHRKRRGSCRRSRTDGAAAARTSSPNGNGRSRPASNHQFASRLRIDAAVWYRTIRDAADPNVFAGTTIIFPNAVARGRAARPRCAPRAAATIDPGPAISTSALGRVRQNGPDHRRPVPRRRDRGARHRARNSFPITISCVVAGGGVTWTHARRGATRVGDGPIRERHADRSATRKTRTSCANGRVRSWWTSIAAA